MTNITEKVLLVFLGLLIGIICTVITERIKRRYIKSDEKADTLASQQNDRGSLHLNVLRDSELVQTKFGPVTKKTWMVVPRWLVKDESGQWRVREWDSFVIRHWAWVNGNEKLIGLSDELVDRALKMREWMVFSETTFSEEATLILTTTYPCDAANAHLFD